MKIEDAGNVQCCVEGRVCQGPGCMGWMSNREGTEGQCIWMVAANMLIKAIAVTVDPTQRRVIS